ncbi:hypothetical protein PLICRDRAFT_179075 [Plicaturopsis crispa FD-325 SS-3]|uniref:GDP-fucose protein O-fucosyltransferase n=1 Tax=Plicaturopsis crispa FD-325 SS-3 TaxID=944288 RepID=A0A0C9T943_PLICR|nr:hypothetical protein PLICRDRAFT_179075 [Plicaturopsis crispa FD-325 SS-3]
MEALANLLERRRGALGDYALLPTSTHPSSPSDDKPPIAIIRPRFTKRYMRTFATAVVSITFICLLFGFDSQSEILQAYSSSEDPSFPPLYEQFHELERNLPQHSSAQPPRKYLYAANHVHASGWGNALQELILNAHLAHSSGRAFVFDNYTWDRDGPDYSEYNGHLIPSRIPLSAMISSPINGGPLPPDDNGPLSVSREYFNEVCPNRTIVSSNEVNDGMSSPSAGLVYEQWLEKLSAIEDPCVEVDRNSNQIFDIWIFGTKRILDIWPTLSKSPMLTQFNWSTLVLSAFEANKALFQSSQSVLYSLLPSFPIFSSPTNPHAPIPGLLALHVRRGDFSGHCEHLAKWSSTWNGFNAFPGLPDTFEVPAGGGWGENTPENREYYMQHCFPTIEQIVEKVASIRSTPEGKGLKRVYIMTNAPKDWIEEMKEALRADGEWEGIASSRDLKLNWEQRYVAQAVDMMVGQRAQVFVGNGFSSLTSNIIMLRTLHEFPLGANRLW